MTEGRDSVAVCTHAGFNLLGLSHRLVTEIPRNWFYPMESMEDGERMEKPKGAMESVV